MYLSIRKNSLERENMTSKQYYKTSQLYDDDKGVLLALRVTRAVTMVDRLPRATNIITGLDARGLR